jgi:hypothetical protein
VEAQTLQPRWEKLSDRQIEFIVAVAALGGETLVSTLARALGRSVKDLSWLRDDLLRAGDLLAPGRGRVALAVPLMAPFALANYEAARQDAGVKLMPLAKIRAALE